MIPAVYPAIGLAAALMVLAAIKLSPYLGAFRNLWFVVIAAAFVLYAGTKPPSPQRVFEFTQGLHDAGSTYDPDTGIAVARWTADAAVMAYSFRWSYRVNGGEWVQLPDRSVSDLTAAAAIPGVPEDTVEILCWTQYVAPPIVHTNGVYQLNGVMRTMNTTNSPLPKYVTPLIPIEANGTVISPPSASPD